MSVVAYFLNERGLSRFATINIFSPPLFRLFTEVMLNGHQSTEVVKCYAASFTGHLLPNLCRKRTSSLLTIDN